jgi:hypothetical protein
VEETGVPEKTTDLLQVITEQTDYFTPNEK